MERSRIIELIEASDLDGLVRTVDGLVSGRDWASLVDLVERCREAVDRGKQVWGAAEYGEYRIARDAPGDVAAGVLTHGAGRFAAGPLWEVASSTHTWTELGPHIDDERLRSLVAQDRLLRGDDVPADALGSLEVPPVPLPWEPRYPVPVYRSDGVDVPGPELPDLEWVELPDPGARIDEPEGPDALLDVVRPWLDESSGRGEAVAVEGTAEAAIRTLGPHRVRLAEVTLDQAVQVMAWAGATGGAYGRRRGTTTGRIAAWWALASLLGFDDEWPVDGEELGREAATLRWVAWDPGDQAGGWSYHLAVEDPQDGIAWAVSAVDAH